LWDRGVLKYWIITRTFANESSAKKVCDSLKGKVTDPIVYYTDSAIGYSVVLYKCKTKTRADEAFRHYRDLGIECFIKVATSE
jgi:hypothetical protein